MAQESERASVGVIVPTFNRCELLEQAMVGLLAQTRPPKEILVVDDGSTDATAKTLSRFADRVSYVRKENGGKASALNLGLEYITSRYVWVFDDDDVPLPNALELMLAELEGCEVETFVYSGCYVFSGHEVPADFEIGSYRPPGRPLDGSLFLRALISYPFHPNGMLVPRACYEAVGGYDETLLRGQDYEMITRLCRAYEGRRLDAATFALRQHAGERGPSGTRHNALDAARVWLAYDRIIFRNVRATVALEEYLSPAERGPELPTEPRQTLALLRRAVIMARHGLLDDALSDLMQALELRRRSEDARLERAVGARLAEMASLTQRPNHDWESARYLSTVLWKGATTCGVDATSAVLRRVYWDLRQRLRDRDWRSVGALILVLSIAGSISSACAAVKFRLS